MKLAIDGGGYASATEAFANGNQLAALGYDTLTSRLAGYAGMAGDDSTSADFAAAYDEAAAESVGALADLVGSFENLGRLTETSLGNHQRADARSVINGSMVYDGGALTTFGYVAVLPSRPPGSLGSNSPDLPDKVNWILDHIEGFLWPGADTDRLRQAAQTWSTAADRLADLETYCDSAIRGFWGERSPEIPLAIDATRELRETIREIGDQYAALAAACAAYADQVEEKRSEILALAGWLLQQIVEGILISIAIGAVTGGTGAAAGLSAVVARVAAESPRFLQILEALRVLVAGTAGTIRATREVLKAARLRLVKFTRARNAKLGEAGQIRLGRQSPGWLHKHERSGSHTLERHVGLTDAQLLRRFELRKPPRLSSTFTDERTAERAIDDLLASRRQRISQWLKGGDDRMQIDGLSDRIIGRSMNPDGNVTNVRSLRAVLLRDSSMPDGFRILTAYPRP